MCIYIRVREKVKGSKVSQDTVPRFDRFVPPVLACVKIARVTEDGSAGGWVLPWFRFLRESPRGEMDRQGTDILPILKYSNKGSRGIGNETRRRGARRRGNRRSSWGSGIGKWHLCLILECGWVVVGSARDPRLFPDLAFARTNFHG